MFKEKIYDATLADKLAKIPFSIAEKAGMRQAFAEMYEILKHCNYEVMSCVPERFVLMLKKYMDPDLTGNLDFSKSLVNMDMLADTRVLLHLVHRDFLCSESERKKLIEKNTLEAAAREVYYLTESLYDLMNLLD